MEKNKFCNCNCDLSKCDMDMTIKECLEKSGIDVEKAKKFLKDCCNCCEEK